MKKSQEYRSDLVALLGRADEITKAWDGKEDQAGFTEAMTELRKVLGKADEAKAMLDLAIDFEGKQGLLDEAPVRPMESQAAEMLFRQSVPGEGVIPPRVMEKLMTPAYKSAFEAYLRKEDVGPTDKKTLSEGVDDAGGVFVPPDWLMDVLKKMAARPSIRQNARVLQTNRDMVRVPIIRYTGSGAKQYTSGVRMKWVGETPASSTAHRVTDPTFGAEAVEVHTAMASIPMTLDFLEDSFFPIEEYIPNILEEAFSLGEEDTFWTGTGVGQPQGILTHAQASVADSETGDGMTVISGAAAALTADGLIDLAFALPEQYDQNAKWYFNKRSTEKAIRKLKDTTNQYLWPVIQQVGNLGPHGGGLLGYPVVRSPFAPNIAAGAKPVAFGDMKAYTIVDRVGLSIQRLREVYAETNLVVFLARKRVGGKLLEPYRLKLQVVSA